MPAPFAAPPHPIAQVAARELMAELQQGHPFPIATFAGQHGGKMFGVLVVKDAEGQVGYLRAFSGTVGGNWIVPGFAPPLFDLAARDAVWPAAVRELAEMSARLKLLSEGPSTTALRVRLEQLNGSLARGARKQERLMLLSALADIETQRRELKQRRTARSCEVLDQLFQGYTVYNARGQRCVLRELFAPKAPPGGAADCAAPKLFAHAYREQLQPIALAEFWWEQAPNMGNRTCGTYYPACTDKCGRVLGFMLQGLG